MFAEGYRQLDELCADLAIDAEDPAQTLTAATVRFLEFCKASIPRYQLMFTRVVPDWEPSLQAYAASRASYDHMVERLAAGGIQGQHAMDLWTALTAGLAAQQLANDPTGDRWVRLSGDVAEMFIDHLRRRT